MKKNIYVPELNSYGGNMRIPIEITKINKGKTVGKGKLSKKHLRKVFEFCSVFDLANVDQDSDYIFDVRGEVIHWLNKDDKEICSSLYFDDANGSIKIELGDGANWTGDFALKKWKDVIKQAIEGGY
ncbi:MAG: hypothetical protein NT120_02900 [Candidatus Aenigmarchaeota archaeon]|nr:hypothetical protein [Candidatus Aenigmarchaeota archaeon]